MSSRPSRGGRRGGGSGGGRQPPPLKIVFKQIQVAVQNKRLKIGRALDADVRIEDGEVSRNHSIVSNGFISDCGSSNGTAVNGKLIGKGRRIKLKAGDRVTIGMHELTVEAGVPVAAELSRSKRFPNMSTMEIRELEEERAAANAMTCEELMTSEFAKIIGHEALKKQLWQFYKKVQLDEVRKQNGRLPDGERLLHMLFMGPPGTGKTTMANLVAKVMVKMKLIATDKVVFVNNALELCAQYAGQTPKRVDDKVAEAKGGVLFIDEAYSIVKDSDKDSFGKEAIETIMKHLDPPSCVFIFAGYREPMNEFLQVNQGLARRIPYRYMFDSYNVDDLVKIFQVMCAGKGEVLCDTMTTNNDGGGAAVAKMLQDVTVEQRAQQNAGMVMNWLSFSQIERDTRVDIDDAIAKPSLASLLLPCDLEAGLVRVKESAGRGVASLVNR